MSHSSGPPYSHARSSAGPYPAPSSHLGRTPPKMGPPPRSAYDYHQHHLSDHRLPPISTTASQHASPSASSSRYAHYGAPISSSSSSSPSVSYLNNYEGSSPHSSASAPGGGTSGGIGAGPSTSAAGATMFRPDMRENSASAHSSPIAADTPDSGSAGPSAAATTRRVSMSNNGRQSVSKGGSGRVSNKQQQQQASSSSSLNKARDSNDGASTSAAQAASAGASMNGATGTETAVQKRKKKAVSCENCRRRKLKCDRGFPCGACRDRDEADQCVWEGGTRPQAIGRDQSNTPLLMRMDRLERLMGTIATKMGVSDPDDADSGENLDTTGKRGDGEAWQERRASTSLRPSATISSAPNKRQRKASDTDKDRASFTENPSATAVPATTSERDTFMSLWPLNWCAPTLDEQRAELFKIMEILPDTGSVRRLCTYFFKEYGWNQHIIDEEDFWQRGLREHEELRVMWQGNRDFHSNLGPRENVRNHLQFVAILCAMCGYTLLNNDQDFQDVASLIEQDFVPGYFFEASTRAFNASAPFDEPTLDSIRILILHCWFTMCFRSTHVGAAVLSMALSQMQALELDFEPPPSMPRKQAVDRLNLFVSLACLDWTSCISFKRSYSLQEEPVKMPYLFGERTLSFKNYDEEHELVNLHRRISLEMARLNRRIASRTAMTEEDAWDETVRIQADLDRLYISLPFIEYESIMEEDVVELDHRMQGRMTLLVTISITLVNLHKRYYIQGWLSPAYRTSKEICFVSSRRICGLFRKSFGTVLPIDQVMRMSVDEIRSFMEKNARFVTRMFPFSHASISACLLLRHHIAMMDAHPSAAGPNAEQVRNDIIEDLRITMRLLLAVSTRSQVARTGVAVLAHSNSSRRIAELGTRPPLQGFTPGPPRSPTNHRSTASAAAAVSASRKGSGSSMSKKRQRELATDLRDITGSFPDDGSAFDLPSTTAASTSTGAAPQHAPATAAPYPMSGPATGDQFGLYGASSQSTSALQSSQQTASSSAPATTGSAAPPTIDDDAYRQLEAFLNGAFQNDNYTGQPLAPEITFERQADRIGAAAPPLLPGAIPRPLSPFTSAFMGGSWDAGFSAPAAAGSGALSGSAGGGVGNDGSNSIAAGMAPQAAWY